MATYNAALATDQFPAVSATAAGQCTASRGELTVSTALADTDVINLCKLPAGHVVVDFILDSDELDTGADAITMKVGITGDDDCLIASTTVGQAGGIARMSSVAGLRLAPSDSDRTVLVTVTANPGTGATGVKLGGTLISRPATDLDK